MARPNQKPVQRGEVAPILVYDVGLSIIAADGAEKDNPAPPPDLIQCDANNDGVEHVDSLDDAFRFPHTGGVPLYRFPIDGGQPSNAPDSEQQGYRSAVGAFIDQNLNASANLSRAAFTDIYRYWQEASGAATRRWAYKWGTSGTGPKCEYITGGANQLILTFPGDPVILTLNGIPENELLTLFVRFDGAKVYGEAWGASGFDLIDFKSAAVVGIDSPDNGMAVGSIGQVRIKRADFLNEFVSIVDPKYADLQARALTEAPLPV